jgi:hypothetical protein
LVEGNSAAEDEVIAAKWLPTPPKVRQLQRTLYRKAKERDDATFLKHTLAHRTGDGPPRLEYTPVTITKSPPKTRVYGGEGKQAVLT